MSEVFARWQAVTQEHLSGLIKVIIGITIGLMAFDSGLILKGTVSDATAKLLCVVAIALLIASLVFGIWCMINRLNDFRLTAQIVRGRDRGDKDIDEERQKSKMLGRLTWHLVKTQLTTFAFGAAASAVAILWQYIY